MFRQSALTYRWLYLNSHTPLEAPVKRNQKRKATMRLRLIVLLLLLPLVKSVFASSMLQMTDNAALNLTKHDLVDNGLSVLLPADVGYTEELNKLQFENKPGMDAAMPGSVIIKNTSQHAVVCFGLRWKIRDSTGFVWTRDVMQMEPKALLDGGRSRMAWASIAAHSAQLITIEGIIANADALRGFTSSFLVPGFTIVSVELDSAIFDDGVLVGADQIGILPVFRATINAKQDLMEEISGRLSLGESLHEVLTALKSAKKLASRTHAPLDPDATYASLRQQYLDELTTTEQNFGQEIAIQSIKHHKFDNRPNIHRRDDKQK